MNSTTYDFAIIGAGAAGLHLALAMLNDTFFDDKKIIILDKDTKENNDRTWCFWEQGNGKWDSIIEHKWLAGNFIANSFSKSLSLANYQYKMLHGIDFYNYAKGKIKASGIVWMQDEIVETTEGTNVELKGLSATYFAKHVFDSRINKSFFNTNDNHIRILQHFRGWYIETEKDCFDDASFTMMDFRLKFKDSASFTYVLPTSKRKALVEFTLFTPELIESKDYDTLLHQYIDTILKTGAYKISQIENGIIPMSNFPFHKTHSKSITKIGTAGGWVKPSSGYSFKNAERFAQVVVNNIKNYKQPSTGIANSRFRMYDTIFLDILANKNNLGEAIFSQMYLNNPTHQIFKFLDEETSYSEDLKIISSFKPKPFVQAFFKQLL
jgi:lycopene beta-cyclase